MEENLHRDGFENFIKNNADDYFMIPSKRVWYSIYNSMHPDRKWPSIAACIIMVSAILFIGVSNNNSINKNHIASKPNTFSNNVLAKNNNTALPKNNTLTNTNTTNKALPKNNINYQYATVKQTKAYHVASNNTNPQSLYNQNDVAQNTPQPSFENYTINKTKKQILNDANFTVQQNTTTELAIVNYTDSFIPTIIEPTTKNTISTITTDNLPENNIEKAWKENYALVNKPLPNKLKKYGSLTYYITASVGYRGLAKNSNSKQTSILLSNSPVVDDANKPLDGAALGIETGVVLNYKISKNTRLKTGLQLNLTNYISKVTALGHSTQANIANNFTTPVAVSYYASKPGDTKLNRSTTQLALPIGADIKVADNGTLQWYIAGTIQPTFILGGSGYVLSADGKNYVTEKSLVRTLNLNSAIETFVSFKTSKGVSINVGPQFRYQLFSTYKKQYTYSEKLYNLGIKVGLTTSF